MSDATLASRDANGLRHFGSRAQQTPKRLPLTQYGAQPEQGWGQSASSTEAHTMRGPKPPVRENLANTKSVRFAFAKNA